MANKVDNKSFHSALILAISWIIATSIGFLISSKFGDLLFKMFMMIQPEPTFLSVILVDSLVGAICGLGLGFSQWFILRTRFQKVNHWIGLTVLGGFISLPIST